VRHLPPAASGPYRARLVDDLEHAARGARDPRARHAFFAAAAAAAATVDRPEAEASRSTGTDRVQGPGLFPFELLDLTSAAVVGGVVEQDALRPISVGATRLRDFQGFRALGFALPLTDAVEDLSFVPEYRELDSVGAGGHCRAIRDLYLAGRARRAATELAQSPVSFSGNPACSEVGSLVELVDAATGKVTTRTAASFDDEQNLLRFAGDLPGAAAATRQWLASDARDATASARAGEVAFLRRRYREAAGRFATAAQLDPSAPGSEAHARLLLQQGAALGLAGQRDEATTVLGDADRSAGALLPPTWPNVRPEDGGFAAAQAALDSYNARLQLGDLALREHEPEMDARASDRVLTRAVTSFEAARAREQELRVHEASTPPGQRAFDPLDPPFRPEVLENNEALALVALGHTADARRAADAAVATDPANQIFLGNQGFVAARSGHDEAARRAYRAAVAADPTAATAANNLGVLLADDGHLGAASAAFRQAIAARHATAHDAKARVARDDAEPLEPDYATAEFNLGLTLGRMGPAHVAESQGWLAAAIRADPELREQDHELVTDDQLYFTRLDLSKPLPPEWNLASAEQRAPATVAGVAVFILIVTLIQVFLLDQLKDKATEGALERGDRRMARLRRLGERIPGWVAVAAVAAVFAYPLLRSSGTSITDYLLVLTGVGIMVFASMRIRLAFTRRAGIATRHYAHVPALVVAGAATALGGAFAPMPAPTEHDAIPVSARWTAIGFLGFMTAALLTIGHVTDVPIATVLGEAALVLTASALVPIKPFDGAYLEKSHVIAAAGFTLAVVGLLVGAGII
jgi:tetratricopeptide (TPR) repeat protein